jgi:hypothetical protein
MIRNLLRSVADGLKYAYPVFGRFSASASNNSFGVEISTPAGPTLN